MRRFIVPLLTTALVVGAAGCGVGVGSPGAGGNFDRRAKEIVDGWHAAGLDTAWQTGFVPLASLTQIEWDMAILKPGADNDRASDAKAAIGNGWYRLNTTLPAGTPDQGEVRFPDGTAMTVPLTSATEAFGALRNPEAPPLAQCGSPQCGLTVTAARLATTTIRTSRGAAVVPAWLFTLTEVTVPAIRVAVAPGAVTPLPDPEVARSKAPWLTMIDAVVGSAAPPRSAAPPPSAAPPASAAQARRLTLHFTGGACDARRDGHVYETPDLVVVGVSITSKPGACDSVGLPATVDVELAQPLGDRALLDAATSQPKTLGDCGPNGYACGRLPEGPSSPDDPTPSRSTR